MQEENARLRSSNKATTQKLEKRLAIEDTHKESQHRFKTIFEQSRLGKKIISDDLCIIQVNKALQQMLGYSKKELVGTRIINYAHTNFIHTWDLLQKNLWKEKIPSFGIETCLKGKNGSCFWCNVTSILFIDNGNTLGYTIVEDISERKSVEEKLKNCMIPKR